MDYGEIYKRIRKVIRDDLHNQQETVVADTTIASLGYDENGVIGLSVILAAEFQIIINLEDTEDWETVRDIARFIKTKLP